jgi:hypothetical protein
VVQGPVLPPLPPLEPPQPKACDSLIPNIPLPSSPPPLLDLLTMEPPPPPPLEEAPAPVEAQQSEMLNGPSPFVIKSQTPAKMKASSKKKIT